MVQFQFAFCIPVLLFELLLNDSQKKSHSYMKEPEVEPGRIFVNEVARCRPHFQVCTVFLSLLKTLTQSICESLKKVMIKNCCLS